MIEEIAGGLAEDPVHVDPAAAPRIPDPALQHITQQADALPYDVYIVILSEDIASQTTAEDLHTATEASGVYLVTSPRDLLWYHVADDGSEEMDGVRTVLAESQRPGSGYEGMRLLTEALDGLAQDAGTAVGEGADAAEGEGPSALDTQEVLEDAVVRREDHHGTDGLGAVSPNMLLLGILLAGIAAAVVATRLLTVGLRKREERRALRNSRLPGVLLRDAARLQRKGIQAALSQDTLRLAADLVALETGDLTRAQAETVRHGLDAYTLAGRLVDAEDATRADLAGALVLLMTAERDLDAVQRERTGEPSPAPTSLCAVNPTHGVGSAKARPAGEWPGGMLRGVSGASAAVCRRCDRDLQAGRTPQWLMDRGRPYTARDTVWARTGFGWDGRDLVSLVHEEVAARDRT